MLRIDKDRPNLNRAKAGLIAATQVDTLDAFQAVLSYIERLTTAEREKLFSNIFI